MACRACAGPPETRRDRAGRRRSSRTSHRCCCSTGCTLEGRFPRRRRAWRCSSQTSFCASSSTTCSSPSRIGRCTRCAPPWPPASHARMQARHGLAAGKTVNIRLAADHLECRVLRACVSATSRHAEQRGRKWLGGAGARRLQEAAREASQEARAACHRDPAPDDVRAGRGRGVLHRRSQRHLRAPTQPHRVQRGHRLAYQRATRR